MVGPINNNITFSFVRVPNSGSHQEKDGLFFMDLSNVSTIMPPIRPINLPSLNSNLNQSAGSYVSSVKENTNLQHVNESENKISLKRKKPDDDGDDEGTRKEEEEENYQKKINGNESKKKCDEATREGEKNELKKKMDKEKERNYLPKSVPIRYLNQTSHLQRLIERYDKLYNNHVILKENNSTMKRKILIYQRMIKDKKILRLIIKRSFERDEILRIYD